MNIEKTFQAKFPVTKGNKARPYLVLLDALIGYGKSYVAERLAKLDGSVVVDNNQVRYVLNDHHDEYKDIWKKLQQQRIKDLLANGNSVIVDECLPIKYQDKLDFYRSLGYPIYIVRLDCNKDVWTERMQGAPF